VYFFVVISETQGIVLKILFSATYLVPDCRSQWPRGLRRRSTAACLLRSWVRIPPVAWMFVCCVRCQVEVSATSRSLVQRSPTDCGASLCVITKPRERGSHSPRWAAEPEKIINNNPVSDCNCDVIYTSLYDVLCTRHNLHWWTELDVVKTWGGMEVRLDTILTLPLDGCDCLPSRSGYCFVHQLF
jgi:hypothetical protein